MKRYRAMRKFQLGTTGVTVQVGQVIEFDGSIVRIGEAEHVFPQLRGAISQGWLEVVT